MQSSATNEGSTPIRGTLKREKKVINGEETCAAWGRLRSFHRNHPEQLSSVSGADVLSFTRDHVAFSDLICEELGIEKTRDRKRDTEVLSRAEQGFCGEATDDAGREFQWSKVMSSPLDSRREMGQMNADIKAEIGSWRDYVPTSYMSGHPG